MALLLVVLGLFIVVSFTLLGVLLFVGVQRIGKERLFPFIAIFPMFLLGLIGAVLCLLMGSLCSSSG